MTKEQEEAIEMLEDIKNNSWTTKYIMSSDSAKAETVLNMLKEKDKEIEHWKNGFERELEDNRKNTCELLKQDLIIREKDKQIDLMANSILTRDIGKNRCQFNETCTKFEKGRDIHCKDCIKQYYERKVEDVKRK